MTPLIEMLGTGQCTSRWWVVAFDPSRQWYYPATKGMAPRAIIWDPATMRELSRKTGRRLDKKNGNSSWRGLLIT